MKISIFQASKNFFMEKVVRNWNMLPTEVAVSLFLEVLKGSADVALRDAGSGHGEDWT